MTETIALRSAAALLLFTASGFGLPCLWAIGRLCATPGEVPILLGFPTYGGGPFERYGINTTLPLLLAFATVSLLEAVAGQ